jgi:Holliday junction DNA helicase RuvA
MIGRLTGKVAEKGMESIVLDVGGVGYDVTCPLTVLQEMPPSGEMTSLAIHTHVREDQITLFGFNDAGQRTLFRHLISISGVGPKIGIACLSGMDSDALSRAIGEGDAKRLTSIPGLGKRTSERIILELRDKVGGLAAARPAQSNALWDLESALKNLGYRPKDVDRLCGELAPTSAEMSFEELLREALQRLRPK